MPDTGLALDLARLTLVPCPVPLVPTAQLPHPERALANGEVIRVRRGVYAPRARWLVLRPWQRYLARVYAVAMLYPDFAFSHESAAALLGIPVIGDPETVHVLVPPTAAARESAGIRSHRTERSAAVLTIGGLLLTSPGATAVTLARHRHEAIGFAALEAALRMDETLTPQALRADNDSRLSSRGRNHARWALDRADGRCESVLESLSVATIEWLGFPAPEIQHEFTSPHGITDRGDLWWEEAGLLGEPDGEFKYDGRFGDPAELLRKRRQRDRRLLLGGVRAVTHWGWIEVARIDPLRAQLMGQGLRQIAPETHAPLRSLQRLLAPYDRAITRSRRERTTQRRENG
ncbi:type IV toxin-antitoxin system AbiEi family antitoxin [Microbacterium invictum]|uniref:AbiEi antitoxin C-terminal domain-containing protein n=1 Tax=Microbacterium invictum TaxID=515415 RepID=A0AA40SM87_9MICO|nr:type IV toxin-antitoxin system AbiEi family antitoxin [Microbacterium invictum]MBB4138747.1 hypothetical protein [Microbacterium invictum]